MQVILSSSTNQGQDNRCGWMHIPLLSIPIILLCVRWSLTKCLCPKYFSNVLWGSEGVHVVILACYCYTARQVKSLMQYIYNTHFNATLSITATDIYAKGKDYKDLQNIHKSTYFVEYNIYLHSVLFFMAFLPSRRRIALLWCMLPQLCQVGSS